MSSVHLRATNGVLLAASLFGIGPAFAAPGDLDPGFNGNGILVLDVSDLGSAPHAVVQQFDGKLVFAGFGVFPDAGADMVAARVLPDGTLDSSFGTDGIARADFAGFDDIAVEVIQQADGKLVLAGGATSGTGLHIALARLNDDGTLDATFGTSGWATLNEGSDDVAQGLVLQPGGKLVVAGRTAVDGSAQLIFARFNANGSLDTTFGEGGTTLVDFVGGDGSEAFALAKQPDDKLVAVGRVFLPTGGQGGGIATRVTADGVLDPSFDSDGRVAVDTGGLFAVAIQPDGAIVIAGYVDVPVGSAALRRFNGDGSIDESFGTAGTALVDLGVVTLNSVVVQADGALVASGTRFNDFGGQDMVLVRFHSDGMLDTSYGIDGIATADFGTGDNAPFSNGNALIQQVDGKHVATGVNDFGSIFLAARFDDAAASPGLIGLTVTSQNVSETDATVTYTVRRTGGKTGAVSVDYATTAGQAQSGSDFDDAPGTLNWSDGDASEKSLSINLVNDAVVEDDEDFALSLSAPTGGAKLAASEATTLIASEDGPGKLAFDFALDVLRAHEDFFNEDGGIRVPVRRMSGSTGAVSVSYATTDGTATAGTDYYAASDTLSWADGKTGVKYIEIRTIHDSAAEGDEDFQIRLSSPTGGATIDAFTSTQLVLIRDNDAGTAIGFNPQTVSVSEQDASVEVTIERIDPQGGEASVDYSTSGDSATADSDFTSTSGTLTWAAGDPDEKTVEIPISNDSQDEPDETFTVSLANPSGGFPLGANSVATVTIVDNDAPSGSGGGGGDSGGSGALAWLELLGLAALAWLGRVVTLAASARTVRARMPHWRRSTAAR